MISFDRYTSIVSDAFLHYEGDVTVFESACGCLAVGMFVGLRPLRIMHSPRTIKAYETILRCSFAELLSLEGDLSHMSVGYSNFLASGSTFGRAVGGVVPVADRKTCAP